LHWFTLIWTHGVVMVFSTSLVCGQSVSQDLHSFPTRRSSDLWRYIEFLTSKDVERSVFVTQKVLPFWKSLYTGRTFCVTNTLRSDRKSTRLNSSHVKISYAVFCLKKKKISPSQRDATDHSKTT